MEDLVLPNPLIMMSKSVVDNSCSSEFILANALKVKPTKQSASSECQREYYNQIDLLQLLN